MNTTHAHLTNKSNADRHRGVARAIRTGILAATLTAGLIIAGTSTASAATRLGGVDMQRACDTQWPGFGLRATVTDQHNAYSWQCRSSFGYRQGIDVNRECVTQYGAGAYSALGNSRNPYSWYCIR